MDKQQRAMDLAADLTDAITAREIDVSPYMPGADHEMTLVELREHIAGVINTVRGFHDPRHYAEAPLPRVYATFVTSVNRYRAEVFASEYWDGTSIPSFPEIESSRADINVIAKAMRNDWSEGRLVRRRGPLGEWRWMGI
tara:strand:- start:467 stop:886 length:420 start_codon:yes stop_codon:yes gene_type:complete